MFLTIVEIGMLFLALGLPWLLGSLWAHAVLARGDRVGRARNMHMTLGFGFPIGMLLVMMVMLLWQALGWPQNFWRTAGVLAVLAIVPLAWCIGRGQLWSASVPSWRQLSRPWKWCCGLFLAWIAVRLGGLLLEVLWRPVYPWDAWFYYAPRARVWFEYGQLVEFISPAEWRRTAELAYAAGSGRHPDGIPLMQYWTLQALGRFDDALMNLPWFGAALASCLALFGLARAADLSLPASLAAVYLLVSLPMFDTHVALAGYGDVWIALFVLLAGGSLYLAVREGDWRPILFVGPAVFGLLMIKQSGMLWVAALVAGIVFAWLRFRHALLVLAGAGLIALAAGFFLDLEIEIRRLGTFAIGPDGVEFPGFDPILPEFGGVLFGMASWHLLWFAVPVILMMAAYMARHDRAVRALAAMIVSGMTMLAVVFLFTEAREWVVDGTNINRSLLHVVPALILLGAVVLDRSAAFSAFAQVRIRHLAPLAVAGVCLWLGYSLWVVAGQHYSLSFAELQTRLFGDWLSWRPWNTPSINRTLVADGQALVSPVLAVAVWVAAGIVAAALWCLARGRGVKKLLPLSLVMFGAGWVVLDLRWQGELWHRLDETRAQFAGKSWEERRAADFDGPEFQFMQSLKSRITDPAARIWIFSGTELYHFRARYHALPQPAYSAARPPDDNMWRRFRAGDYVALLDVEVLRPGGVQRPQRLPHQRRLWRFPLSEAAGADAFETHNSPGSEVMMGDQGRELLHATVPVAPPPGFYVMRARLRGDSGRNEVRFQVIYTPPGGAARVIASRQFDIGSGLVRDYELPFLVPGPGRIAYRVLAHESPGLSALNLETMALPAPESLAFLSADPNGPYLVVRPLMQSSNAMAFEVF